MANNEQFLTINSNKIVSTKKDVIIGEDNTDILNINSKLSFSGRDNIILPIPISSDSNKLLKINNSGNSLELDNNGIGNNTKAYIVCSELSSDNWGDITPVDGELTVFPGQEIMFYINASGSRSSNLCTWTFQYKIDSDSSFTSFNYPTNSQFKHYFNASSDNQHRSATFYFRNNKSSNVVLKKFKVTFNGSLDNSEDFVTITGAVLNSKEVTLIGAGGTESTSSITFSHFSSGSGYSESNIIDNLIYGSQSQSYYVAGLKPSGSNWNNTVDWHVIFNFVSSQIVTGIRLWMMNATSESSGPPGDYFQLPKRFRLYGSNDSSDSSSWNLIKTTNNDDYASVTSIYDWPLSKSVALTAQGNEDYGLRFNFNNSSSYLSYKILISGGGNNVDWLHTDSSPHRFGISEIAFYSNISLFNKEVLSFKPDIPLAGGGGNLFENVTSSALHNINNYPLRPLIYNNILNIDQTGVDSAWTSLAFHSHSSTPVANPFLAYEFADPQIVTSYRMWPMGNITGQAPKGWELRASADSATYNSGSGTYTVLDIQSNQTFQTWSTTGNLMASLNFDKGNLYHIENPKHYKFYLLHFTSGYHTTVITLSEWALYGDGLILPDQTNNANKKLITNGINLEWSDDVEPILTGSGSSHEIIKVNSNSNGLEYGGTDAFKIPCANNLFRPYIPSIGMMRYNNESNYYEVYNNNKWNKIVTKDMYGASIGLLNRDFVETDFNDKINNSYGYYIHGRNNPPLFSGGASGKLAYNMYHSLTFDTVLYDDSPLQNMADISNNRINIKKTGDYLITYKSSFRLTNTINQETNRTQQLSTNFKIKLNKNNSLLYESNLIKGSSALINNKTHFFIDDFNYITSLEESDYITIQLFHLDNVNNKIMLSYDYVGGYSDTDGYNIDTNYNYEYMKYIASQLTIKKLLIV